MVVFNITTWFILPSLSISIKDFIKEANGKNTSYYLYDCYLNFDDKDPKLYIILENSKDQKFRLKLMELKTSLYYQDSIEEENIVILSFKIPFVYLNDYFILLNGGYSQISNTYKNKLLEVYKEFKKSNIPEILSPSETSIRALERRIDTKLVHREIHSIIKREEEEYRDMFIVLKPTEEKYLDVAIGFLDSKSGKTSVVCNVNSSLFDKDKVAVYLVDSLNKNIEDLDVNIVK